jgi:16S rRNA processing protein RimM
MDKNQCFSLGKITKSHGLKGEVIIYLDVDDPEKYAKLDALFLDIKGQLIPFIIEQIQIRGKKSILKIEDINTIEQAEPYINAEVWLPLNALPKLKGKSFYYHDVIGYSIFDLTANAAIGNIKAIYESTGNDLFAVDHEGIEILVPIVDEFISEINHNEKQITLKLPEGLLEVYLNP